MAEPVAIPGLRDALRFSARATTHSPWTDFKTTENTGGAGDPRNNPILRKLIAKILFSRRFIITYQYVLLALLAIFTLTHWSSVRSRKRRREAAVECHGRRDLKRDVGEDESSHASSSSSTLEGTESPPRKEIDQPVTNEMTPLIPIKDQSEKQSKRPIVRIVKSYLIYQPPPLPYVNKTLPPNLTSLAVLFFLGLNLFYTLYNVTFSVYMIFDFADRCGLVFVANLPWLYLLAMKNCPLRPLTGFSYESLNIIHRRLGEWMCLLAVGHGVGMLGVWYTLLHPRGETLAQFLSTRIILLGLLAFISYELLYLSSLGSFRQRFYELFLASHISLQLAALILLFFHHHNARNYVVASLVIIVLDRVIFRMFFTNTISRGTVELAPDGSTVLFKASIPQRSNGLRSYLNPNIRRGWKPGQHIFLSIPTLGIQHALQAHPFTIAASKNPLPEAEKSTAIIPLYIRAHGGFSSALLKHTLSQPSGTKIDVTARIDGPYGSTHAIDMLRSSSTAILIAGGSGVAVAMALLTALLPDREEQDASNLSRFPRRIVFAWIVREREHYAWIGGDAALEAFRSKGVHVVLPTPTEESRERPDVAEIVEDAVERYSDDNDDGDAGVVVSGPDQMNRAVNNACARLVREGREVEVAVEKYGW